MTKKQTGCANWNRKRGNQRKEVKSYKEESYRQFTKVGQRIIDPKTSTLQGKGGKDTVREEKKVWKCLFRYGFKNDEETRRGKGGEHMKRGL